jgi:four helix bundle protein
LQRVSAAEVQSQLYVAFDQTYIDRPEFDELKGMASETGRMLGGLMSYLRNSQFKGTKYKKSTSK